MLESQAEWLERIGYGPSLKPSLDCFGQVIPTAYCDRSGKEISGFSGLGPPLVCVGPDRDERGIPASVHIGDGVFVHAHDEFSKWRSYCTEPFEFTSHRAMAQSPQEYSRIVRDGLDFLGALRGDSRIWWQREPEGCDNRWKACIRRAIERFARRSKVEAKWCAQFLDEHGSLKLRSAVIELARDYYREGVK